MKMEIATFKALATGVSSLYDDAVKLDLTKEGLNVKIMDKSSISMVYANIPFISKEDNELEGLTININLLKALKSIRNEKVGMLSLKATDTKIYINAGTSEVEFPIEEIYDNPKCPKLEDRERITATFDAKQLKDAINELGNDINHARFIWNKNILIIAGKSENGTIKKTFNNAIMQDGTGKVLYPISYLKDALKVIRKGKILMFFNKDIPCELNFNVDGVDFKYWIAPAVDSEDETEIIETTTTAVSQQPTETQPTTTAIVLPDVIPETKPDAVEQPTETQPTAQPTQETNETKETKEIMFATQETQEQMLYKFRNIQATGEITEEMLEANRQTREDAKTELKRFRITVEVEVDETLSDITTEYLEGCFLMDSDFKGFVSKLIIRKIDKNGNEVDENE